ncbi:AAA family ATPase [Anaerocolumna sp. MB42-C2]|uniref:AAA family ATPase n=1 Tax=Anaerocolumna sp. MB42-C2 TaxID=3070997 RepID=UPI0027E0E7D5|nr:AAA family ATPase [Anaerocolumna sp. MB42-C2]WMJ86113.1 AAA family ATPase [Anaerocolumna sp. MB42-C2]
MVNRIAIVGGNGSGKTTMGAALSKALDYKHMDIEDYYFEDTEIPYSRPRTRKEVLQLMEQDAFEHSNFIISAVNADLGDQINSLYECVIYLKVPLEIRLKRVKERSYDKFGDRVLTGGDLYEQEQEFFDSIVTKTLEKTDDWVKCIPCPIIYADGTKPIDETVGLLLSKMAEL